MSNVRVTQEQLIGMIHQSLIDVSTSYLDVDVEGQEEDPTLFIVAVCRAAEQYTRNTALAASTMGVDISE